MGLPVGAAEAVDAVDAVEVTTDDRPLLCYGNFLLRNHPCRPAIFESLRDRPFFTSDVFSDRQPMSMAEYYRQLMRSKFVLCPRGYAEQTFRFWECLYFGAVPIAVRADYHAQLGDDLPILLLDSIRDYASLTRPFLEEKYAELMSRPMDSNKLRLSYWLDRIDRDFSAADA